MHVLIIPSWYPSPGNGLRGIFFKEQALALAKRAQVGVVAATVLGLRDMVSSRRMFHVGIEADEIPPTYHISVPAPPKAYLLRARIMDSFGMRLYRLYCREHGEPDLLHAHSVFGGLLARRISMGTGIPYVVTEHSSLFLSEPIPPALSSLASRVYSSASSRLAVSPALAEKMKDLTGYDFTYFPNPVDTDFFTPDPAMRRPDTVVFSNIGFMNPNKNQRMLVEAFAPLASAYPHARLVIGGTGTEYGLLRNLVEKAGLRDRIELPGILDRESVKRLLQRSDVFLLSSKHETFSLITLEALSCGVPVIATPCEGPSHILRDPQLGTLLPDFTPQSMRNAMEQILAQPPDANPQHLHALALATYGLGTFVDKSLHLYESLTSAPPRSRSPMR